MLHVIALFFIQAGFAVDLNVRESQKIYMIGQEASLQVTGTNSPQLKIQLDPVAESEYQIEESDQAIRITKKAAAQISSNEKEKPKAKIEISGKVLPLEVHLQEGNVTVTRWTKDLFLHLQKGRIVLKGNQSLVVAHAQKGEISVVEHKGKVIVDNLQAAVNIKDLVGDLDLQTYQGDSILENMKGNLVLHTTNGASKIIKGSGSLQFEIGKGSLHSQTFQGRVEGQVTEGNIQVTLSAGEDVNVKSQSGKITVTASPNSGAFLNAITADGEIYGPAHLKILRDGSQKILKGRLKGEVSENSIQLRSQDGIIIVK